MVTTGLASLGVASVSAAQSGALTVVPSVGSSGETLLGEMAFSAGPYGQWSREKAQIARIKQRIENKQARIAELRDQIDGSNARRRERLRDRIEDFVRISKTPEKILRMQGRARRGPRGRLALSASKGVRNY